jgi:CheY-like chemotaxis protein
VTSDASNKQIVLVVEDDPMLRGILAEALAGEGLVVLTAATGEEALAIASPLDGQLGLVVTDILLPHIDGLELADHLAGLSSPPPVLFISGVKVKRTLPGPLLAKPFGPMAFLEQVGRMLTALQQAGGTR